MRAVKKYYLQVYCHALSTADEEAWVDPESLGLHPETALRLAEMGILEVRLGKVAARQAGRALKLLRLRRGLGVNLPGAAIILDLLERVESLQEEINRLKRR